MIPQGQVIIIHTASEAQDLRVADSGNRQSKQDLVGGMHTLETSVIPAGPLQRTAPAVSFAPEPQVQSESSDSAHQGLVFQTENGSTVEDDALQALSLIAQVYFKSLKYSRMCLHKFLVISRIATS